MFLWHTCLYYIKHKKYGKNSINATSLLQKMKEKWTFAECHIEQFTI